MKNILLIVTDTFRYDNLGSRASMPVNTPELDRFAAERATSIERFYTGSFPTIPQRTDVVGGYLGWPHYGWQSLEASRTNHIAQILRQNGYATQLLCDCPHLFNAGFQRGFHAAFQHRGQEADIPLLHLNDPIPIMITEKEKTRQRPLNFDRTLVDIATWVDPGRSKHESDTFCYKTSTTAVRWLEDNYKASPFFLWIDFFDPHEPWDAPEYMVRHYDPDYSGEPMLHPNYSCASFYTPEELRNLRAHYAAEAELVDRGIGRVLQKLDDLRLWDETLVVITSDHGFSIGEHARTGKSNISVGRDSRYWPIYPEVGHVPFLIAGPGVAKGKSLDIFGQPVDILPTVCELAGVPLDPPRPIDGLSLASSIQSSTPGPRQFAVSGCYAVSRDGRCPQYATTPFLTTKRWGYAPVGAKGLPELYDLTADPLAENDVAAGNSAVVKEMHALLVDFLQGHGASPEFISLWCRPGGEGYSPIDYRHSDDTAV